ncbi:MAG: winged helix-turn-helix transcriptional regulator [Acidobacteriaceae bacterium]
MVQDNSSVRAQHESSDGGSIPVASMVESIVGCKWSVRLLQLCAEGHSRPSAFLRACPGLSAKVMNERLRKMARFGIVQRTVFGEKPPIEVEYRLTLFGLRFMGVLDEVHRLQEAVDTVNAVE